MLEELKKIIKGDVLSDEETLREYSRDASLFEVRPKIVIYPKDADDIKNLVRWVTVNKAKDPSLSITVRAAGTDMTGGPLNESIIVDVSKYMYGIVGWEGNSVRVRPGTFYRDFERETLERGLILPSYPASKGICALGGMVANNAGGEKTLIYGKTEEYVKELKVVLGDGNEYVFRAINSEELDQKIERDGFEGKIYEELKELIISNYDLLNEAKPKVSKNSAGYYVWNIWNPLKRLFDLNKLFVGSQGTLGIITEIVFELVPVKKQKKAAVIFLKDIEKVPGLINSILQFGPESIESYDDKTLKLAIKFFPQFLKGMGIIQKIRFAWSFWPDLFILLRRGLPKLVLLVEFTGDDMKSLKEKAALLGKTLQSQKVAFRVAKNDYDAEKYWRIRRESFNLLRKHVKGKRTAPFIDDFIVRPDRLGIFLPELNSILSQYPIEYTIAGHAASGNFHIIPLMDMGNPKNQEIIFELSDKVYDLVIKYGGSITGEHNDGIIRTPYLRKMYGERVYGLFGYIKKIFDPQNIFNPGKKVEGSKENIRKYLIKS